jgi:LEA14-like dessication related protein
MHGSEVALPDRLPCSRPSSWPFFQSSYRPRYRLLRLVWCSLLLLAGCVTLPSDFKEPGVSLVSIRPQIENLFAPEFDVVLHVTNPNREALDITGLSYTVHLQGKKLVQGVANELPVIAAYGEADIRLRAAADFLGGISLLSDFLNQPGEQFDYEFNADIDLGTLYPMVRVQRSGVISLR